MPIYGADGRVWSIEAINDDGDKDSLKHGKKRGGFYPIAARVHIAEGIANAAVGAEVDKSPAVAAMGKSNLVHAARTVRELAPDAELIILADNDLKLPKEAHEAAVAIGGRVVIPELDGRKCDLWDVWNEHGIEAVRRSIANANAPTGGEPHPDATNAPKDDSTFKEVIESAIEKLAGDIGAVFEPPAVTALKAVRKAQPADYQRYRKRIKEAGASVVELDRLVCANGGGEEEDSGQGRPLDIADPEPWHKPVDGAELLDGLVEIYRRYLVLPAHAAVALALWVVHSYIYDFRCCAPILAVLSPQKRCGKTRLMSMLAILTLRALPASNITPSAVFRTVDSVHPTLIIDEADTFLRDNEELRGVINSGHTRDLAYVIRLVGEDYEPRKFSTWCPKAIAMIGKLPGTILDRSIVIKMSRRKNTEAIADLAEFTDAEQIRRRCIRWVKDNQAGIASAKPHVPPELHDRAADNWRPLLAIADLAKGAWPERARAAALGLSEGTEDDAHSLMLLHDIRELFTGETPSLKCFETLENGVQIAAEDMWVYLVELEDRPWGECNHGKAITKNWIARRLGDFGVKPHKVNPPGGSRGVSGYLLRDFADAFDRYLAPQTDSQIPSHPPLSKLRSSASRARLSFQRFPKFRNQKPCGVFRSGETGAR